MAGNTRTLSSLACRATSCRAIGTIIMWTARRSRQTLIASSSSMIWIRRALSRSHVALLMPGRTIWQNWFVSAVVVSAAHRASKGSCWHLGRVRGSVFMKGTSKHLNRSSLGETLAQTYVGLNDDAQSGRDDVAKQVVRKKRWNRTDVNS